MSSRRSPSTAPIPGEIHGPEAAACWAAMRSRDRRFDGQFVSAVVSTSIYCRPSCPALVPLRRHVRFLPTAAGAQAAGFRACLRCRPDAAPGSPAWDVRADVVGRAVRLLDDGLVDRAGVEGLAAGVGYSPRQLRRLLVEEVGAGPLALARARRAHAARVLLEDSDLSVVDIAFAAGFGSLRQCNDTVREVYGRSPTQLRGRARAHRPEAGRGLALRLGGRAPADVAASLAFLAAHAVAGVEQAEADWYARSLRLPHGAAVVQLRPGARVRDGEDVVDVELWLADPRDLPVAMARVRRMLHLDADPGTVDDHLAADPALAPLICRWPGRRLPGGADGAETAVRALLGQQISLAAARRLGARVADLTPEPLPAGLRAAGAAVGVTRLFPAPEALRELDPAGLPMPRSRARGLHALAGALADGTVRLDPGADRDEAEQALLALPGVGRWTARYVRMRGLGDPDVALVEDLAVRRSAALVGLPADAAGLAAHARRWAPWRSSATALLYAVALDGVPGHPVAQPGDPSEGT